MAAVAPMLGHPPSERQQQFLLHAHTPEVFYGGAAGGGKSSALLMAALQFVHTPGYAALLLRRTFRDLNQPDALVPRSKGWLSGHADWSALDKRWTFPSGATLTFGYCDHADDIYQYQGAAFQFIGFDELTQFTEPQYLYLFSRLRKPAGGPLAGVPVRMRAASNPGGIGHEWVKRRFIAGAAAGRVFVPARLRDNPGLDADEYRRSLMHLDGVTRAQLLGGDWSAYEGGRFRREWFRRYDTLGDYYDMAGRPGMVVARDCVRFATLDPAATAKESSDYTAILVGAVTPAGDLAVLEVVRERLPLDRIVPRLADVCQRWRPQSVGIEATGFQAAIVQEARRNPLVGGVVTELSPEGKGKLVRATPAVILAESGQLYLPVAAPWLDDFEAELVQFTGDERQDAHDDQVDALAYAVLMMQGYYLLGGAGPAVATTRAW
jgi:predicted phage terminase large subunit-like protein